MSKEDNLENRIVETAERLFIEKGFEQTSMSDIAAAAGISRTALHYYFRTKDKMFQAVFGSIMLSFLPKIQEIFDRDIPFENKLSKVIDQYFEIFTRNPSLPRFILGEIQRDVDHLMDTGRALHLDSYLSAIASVILAEMEKGTIKKLPIEFVLLTFMSQVTFPFLSRNLMMALFYEDNAQYEEFLARWKENILRQMENIFV